MAGSLGGLIEDAAHAPFEFVTRREQRHRIEIALHGAIKSDRFPTPIEIDAPIEADHIAARFFHQWKQRGCVRAEMD